MKTRENEIRRDNIRFDGNDIALAASMIDKMKTTIDILYYLMDRGEERSFVVMLVSANNIALKELLEKEKRNTDILFEIDKEKSLYAIVCQDTKVDGGYRFAQRVVRNLTLEKAEEIYCIEVEVRITTYDIKYIIFKLIESYIKTKQNKKTGDIIFSTIQ